MTLVEAYDGRTTEQRWDWGLSRLQVVDIGKDEARQARSLADAKLHGHKYAIDAVLAVIARQQKGQVTVFTSDVDALEKLVPTQSWSRRCDPPRRVLVVNGELHTTGLRVAADGAACCWLPDLHAPSTYGASTAVGTLGASLAAWLTGALCRRLRAVQAAHQLA